jgi:hypothetical protein
MEGEKNFSILPDLNQGKDLVWRVNYDLGPVDFGGTGYYGQGQIFSQASPQEFKNFPRGAGNAEVHAHAVLAKVLGETRFFAEGTIGVNMDRGLNYGPGIGLPALPAPAMIDQPIKTLNELSLWGRVEQDLTKWATVGLRVDYYNPNYNVCEGISTCSSIKSGRITYGAVAAVHFTRWLQYMLEYDHSVDNVHLATAPAPSKQIDVISNVLQVRF